MNPINAYAALQAKQSLQPFQIQRREPKPHDVVIEILYCGVCHSDLHKVKDEWGNSIYPLVPGHEIVGKVSRVGTSVSRYKIGDHVGVGCFVDSCRQCPACKNGTEQYCDKNMTQTYNAIDRDGALTQGGYSTQIVVDENYVVKIPANLPLDKAAPLLCAGITTYSPLRHWQVKPGDKVAIIGLGGLGHMGVKLAKAMGAEVTVLSTSQKKSSDAYDLGAKNFTNTSDAKTFSDYAGYFNIILNTVSSNIELDKYLGLLKLDGTLVLLGVPEKPYTISPFSLIWRRRQLAGSLIGGIKETQEMLDFCSKHNITSDIELIPMQKINEAYERMVKGDVRYRFVIDMKSLRS